MAVLRSRVYMCSLRTNDDSVHSSLEMSNIWTLVFRMSWHATPSTHMSNTRAHEGIQSSHDEIKLKYVE